MLLRRARTRQCSFARVRNARGNALDSILFPVTRHRRIIMNKKQKFSVMWTRFLTGLLVLMILPPTYIAAQKPGDHQNYFFYVRKFAETLIERGPDRYGPKHLP